VRSLDDHEKREGAGGAGRASGGGVGRLQNSEAFNRFRAADSRGVSGGAAAPAVAGTRLTATGTELLTLHQNTITSVRAFEGGVGGQDVSQVSTTGVDGRVVVWSTAGGVGGVTQGVGRLGL